MTHILVRDDDVVLGRTVISNVVINNQPHETVEQRKIDLFKHLFKSRLQHDDALAFIRVPDVRQVIDALAPLVHEERRGLIV